MCLLEVVIGVGDDGLRAVVQQFLYAVPMLPPPGGAEHVQAETPQGGFKGQLL